VLSAAEGASRTAKLRRIIVAADPSVQQVAMQLNAASEAVLSAEIQQAFSDVETAQTDLQTSVARGRPTATIAAKQATLIQRVDTLRRISAVNGSFAQLAQTHTALADAARSGISDNDFETSILELITLIKTLRETL
jgi:thioredoxin-like negative regulator of GroEL